MSLFRSSSSKNKLHHPHKRNLSLQKLISASTLIAPTHDRVVGMNPDDVKTPISTTMQDDSLEMRMAGKEAQNGSAPAPKVDGEKIEVDNESAQKAQAKVTKPEDTGNGVAGTPSETTNKPGTDAATPPPVQKAKEEIKQVTHKVKSLGVEVTKSPYFRLEENTQKRLKAAFLDICTNTNTDGEPKTTISRTDMASFLKNVQLESQLLNQISEEKLGGDKRWTYEEWLSFMCRHGGLEGVRPVCTGGVVKGHPDEAEVLKHPITSYFIDSSHNTYLKGNQWFSESDAEEYRYVLEAGCRCIEIDVHNGVSLFDDNASTNQKKSYIKPTLPSEVALQAKSAKADVKAKWNDFKSFVKGKTDSFSDSDRKKADGGRLKEVKKGHKRNESSTSTIPTIQHQPSTDSEGSPGVDSEQKQFKTGTDTSDEAKDTLKTKSRSSSKSSVASVQLERTGEPIVMHGWTPTTKPVFFRDVCKTVAQYAFVNTPLPLIVSLEVACDHSQQELMVKIMKEEWKGYMLDIAHPMCDPNEKVPNLEDLLNKILIKVKRATAPAPSNGGSPQSTTDQPAQSPTTSTQTLVGSQPTSSLAPSVAASSTASTLSPTPTQSSDKLSKLAAPPSGTASGAVTPVAKPKISKICANLAALGIYSHSEHFPGNFSHPSSKLPAHIYSISENNILDLYEKNPDAMLEHNAGYFMRAYPGGHRVDSSNMDPSIYWRKGVQMVAVNWQVWDEGTMVNRAMFDGSGGWVLKPTNYRPESKTSGLPITQKSPVSSPLSSPVGSPKPDQVSFPPRSGSVSAEHKAIARASALDPPVTRKPSKKLHSPRSSSTSINKKSGTLGGPRKKTLDIYIQLMAAQSLQGPSNMKPRVKIEMHCERDGSFGHDDWKKESKTSKSSNPDFGGERIKFEGCEVRTEGGALSFVRFKVEDDGLTGDDILAWRAVRLDRLRNGFRFVRLWDKDGKGDGGMLLVHVERVEHA